MIWQHNSELDAIHHVAIEVDDVKEAIDWYADKFRCKVAYEDDTWALLQFGNLSIALVTRGEHPAHIGFVTETAAEHGELKTHRDGTRSIYLADPAGNAVELLDADSVKSAVTS